MPRLTLEEIARVTGGRVEGDGGRVVTGAAPPATAGPDDLTFIFHAKALGQLLASRAGAAVVPEGVTVSGRDVVFHPQPQAAMAAALAALYPAEAPAAGVHPSAVVDGTAELGEGVSVGPFAVVGARAKLGPGVAVGAGCFVAAGAEIGEGTRLHPQVSLYGRVRIGRACVLHSGVVIGADGFGFVRWKGRHMKIPQVGGVEIADDVEIGANTCVDGGTMTPTRIGENTKIDNLVQVGHNCEIGQRVIVCGQVALAGSTIVEDDVTLAGLVGVAGHLRIGRGAVAAAGCGIISDVAPGARVGGHPQAPLEEWLRSAAALRHLPELRSELRRLMQRVRQLEEAAGTGGDGGGEKPAE